MTKYHFTSITSPHYYYQVVHLDWIQRGNFFQTMKQQQHKLEIVASTEAVWQALTWILVHKLPTLEYLLQAKRSDRQIDTTPLK